MRVDEASFFDSELKEAKKIHGYLAKINDGFIGQELSGRQMRVATLFIKLLAHFHSLLSLAENNKNKISDFHIFDHFSICALSRVCVDASLMNLYLSEPGLEINQWDLRRSVLYLHDMKNRERFLSVKGVERQSRENIARAKIVKDDLRKRIRITAASLGYKGKKIEELSSGNFVFVDGLRGVVREAGWEISEFEFQQLYLSNYIHSHPVSWIRAQEHQVDFFDPSPAQYTAAGVGLTAANTAAELVSERCSTFLVPGADPLAVYFDRAGNRC